MTEALEQFGTQLDVWFGEGAGNRPTTFFVYEKNGNYTAVGMLGHNYWSQPFDHLPSRQEVEDHFLSDPAFASHLNVIH